MKSLSIGTVAKSAGISVEAIRYYEKEGLLEKARRTGGGYRQYTSDVVGRLSFIGRAQDLGFALGEIRELLDLRASSTNTCSSVREKADQKIAVVESKIAELQRIRSALQALASSCPDAATSRSSCPILDALAQDGGKRPQ